MNILQLVIVALSTANVSGQNNWVFKCNLCYSAERDIGKCFGITGRYIVGFYYMSEFVRQISSSKNYSKV
jgi:hypothetical protein